MILTRNCWKKGLQLVCSAGNTAVDVHCRVTQILIEKHPEILPHHQLGRVVATVSLNWDTNSHPIVNNLPSYLILSPGPTLMSTLTSSVSQGMLNLGQESCSVGQSTEFLITLINELLYIYVV